MKAVPAPELSRVVEHAIEVAGPVVLAVSGGRDSMTLLHLAAHSRARALVRAVATWDHGTGGAATAAASLVARSAAAHGFPVIAGRGAGGDTEAEWRDARWRFLRAAGAAQGGRVATAHTLDDQAETVCMRILRGSGVRGLAGLLAGSDVVRPLVTVSREAIARFAAEAGVAFVEDPTNLSRRHLRNRVRLDVLPAIRAVRPAFEEELIEIGRRAAAWRAEVEQVAAELPATVAGRELCVARDVLEGFDAGSLAVLWPALLWRAGAILDRRGIERLVAFTGTGARTGARIQLSGGLEVIARRDAWLMRPTPVVAPESPLSDGLTFGAWRFRARTGREAAGDDPGSADLPDGVTLSVRAWRDGDRMRGPGGAERRVKRFLADARIAGPERAGWPVVLAGDRIVWIPGVCRSDAATDRSGRPAARYLCERTTTT